MVLFYQLLSEKHKRLYAANEALKLGYGGISYIASVLNCDRKTIYRGISELKNPETIEKDKVTDITNASLPTQEAPQKKGTFLIATVKGDVHDIGKCIVVSLVQANGYKVYDLGRNVAVDPIVEEAVKVDADIIGTSALLTTTMTRQKDLEDALKSAGLRDKFKTIVGGTPVTGRGPPRSALMPMPKTPRMQ